MTNRKPASEDYRPVASEPQEPDEFGEAREQRRTELQELILEDLEKFGILKHGDHGELIVDFDIFRDILSTIVHNHRRIIMRCSEFHPEEPRRFFALVFQGIDVVSKEDFERAKHAGEPVVLKPLFYEPESQVAAFDPEAIREAEFYIGPWEIFRKSPLESQSLPTLSGEDVDYRESSIAAVIYHPEYGQGYRDPDTGKLMVWWPSRKEFRPISVNWFDREMSETFAINDAKLASLSSPGVFLPEFAPHLIETGLLTPDDFRTKSGRDAIEGLRQSRRIGAGGKMMIGSVDYFFGRGRETMETLENAEAFPVGPSLGVMIQEDPETQRRHLTHTFQMFQHGDSHLKRHSVKKSGEEIFRVNQEDANLQEYDSRTFHRKRSEETIEAFNARVETVENFEYLLRIADRIRAQNGPDLLKLDYDPLTLISAATRAIHANQSGFVRFIREYGLNGLRSVVGFDGEEKATRALYKLGDELPQALAHRIMARIGRVANAVASVMKQAGELLPDGQTIGSEEAGQIRAQLLRRGGDVLFQLTQELAASDVSEASVEARIAEEMKKIEAPLLVLASAYKVFHDEGQRVKLEDLKDVAVDVESVAEISKKDRAAMREISDENWSKYPRLHAAVVEGFDAALQNPENRFYITRYCGEMLGFVRFDDLNNGNVYAGSLNIRPELRGSALGETILKMAIAEESRSHKVEATAYPKLPIAERYIGDFGFVVSGMIPNFEKTGEALFKMEIDPRANSSYRYLNAPLADIKRDVRARPPAKAGSEPFVLQFDLHGDYHAFLEACNQILRDGTMVMTAYRRDQKESGMVWAGFEPKVSSASSAAGKKARR